MATDPPEICSFQCSHADFPPPETAGICRTMAGVWCTKLVELVSKNVPCEWRNRQAQSTRTGGSRLTSKKKGARRGRKA